MCEWTSRPDERITGPPIERMTLTHGQARPAQTAVLTAVTGI
jgi:hypothetical protein